MTTESTEQSAPVADERSTPNVVIVGAGPAGLTAAYMLNKRGVTSTVLEGDTVVGGISRTAERDGWRFDIGGHRFFTKVQPVEDLWFEILGRDDFLRRPRLSRGRRKKSSGPRISNQRSSTGCTLVKKRWPPMSKRQPSRSTVRLIPPTTESASRTVLVWPSLAS